MDDMPPPIEDDSPPPIEDLSINNKKKTESSTTTTKKDDGEEKSLMQNMIDEATVAKKKKDEKKAKLRKKADKSFGKGLKKGFFNNPKPKKKKKAKKNNSNSNKKKSNSKVDDDVEFEINTEGAKKLDKKAKEEMPFLRAKKGNANDPNNPLNNLRIPEVQAAMKNTLNNKKEWMTPHLLRRFATNPKLALVLQNPRFVKAMEELQKEPDAAMAKYKDDEALQDFLQEFMGLMGDHMVNLGEAKKEKEAKKQKSEQERQKQQEEAMRRELEKADPEVAKVLQNQEVAQILADPNMQKIMQECTQPGVLRKYMSDPVIAKKFRILQKHGLIQMHF